MSPMVWHLRLGREERPKLRRWIERGEWELPADAGGRPRKDDVLYVHIDPDDAAAVARILDDRLAPHMAMRWAWIPFGANLRGIPRRRGLRMARAFAGEQRLFAYEILSGRHGQPR